MRARLIPGGSGGGAADDIPLPLRRVQAAIGVGVRDVGDIRGGGRAPVAAAGRGGDGSSSSSRNSSDGAEEVHARHGEREHDGLLLLRRVRVAAVPPRRGRGRRPEAHGQRQGRVRRGTGVEGGETYICALCGHGDSGGVGGL